MMPAESASNSKMSIEARNAALFCGRLRAYTLSGVEFVAYDDGSKAGRARGSGGGSAQQARMAKGNFPSVIPKTDQERVQNLVKEIATAAADQLRYEVTEKLEGSSMTVYLIDGEFGVCSRNLDLKETEGNTFWQVARLDDTEDKMRIAGLNNFAIQGELIGPGIQGNIYRLNKPEFRVFDVYNIQTGAYLAPHERRALIKVLDLLHVPVLHTDRTLGAGSVEEILQFAEGKSVMGDITGPEREGIVFKEAGGGMSFKAISNKYLLGEK
jgi:RNA ligase (TIGR02306 family)